MPAFKKNIAMENRKCIFTQNTRMSVTSEMLIIDKCIFSSLILFNSWLFIVKKKNLGYYYIWLFFNFLP